MEILQIKKAEDKACIANAILRALPEWFGIEAAISEYVAGVADKLFFAAVREDGTPLGFFAGDSHYGHTGEIYVCGVLPDYHRNGVGTALYEALEQAFLKEGYDTLLVKTLSSKHPSSHYALTRVFYRKQGFRELLDLPELWGEKNPCLLMEKRLTSSEK